MGWAKYFEDDMDFMTERQNILWNRVHQSTTEVVCTGTMPLTKFFVVVEHKAVTAPGNNQKGKSIVCKDCGITFVFSKKEQKTYKKNEWADPKRCKCCRSIRRSARVNAEVY